LNNIHTDLGATDGQKHMLSRKEMVLAALVLVIIIGSLVAAIVFRQDLAKIEAVSRYGLLGVLVITFVACSPVSATAIPIPYILLVFTLPGLLASRWGLLGPVWVGLAAAIGATIGETLTFMIGYGGWHISQRLASRINAGVYQKAETWVKKHGAWAVFVVTAVPNPVYLPMTIAVGTLKFSPPRWFASTFAGNLVKDLCIAFGGYFGVSLLLRWLGA